MKIYDCYIPVFASLLVCGTIWGVGYFVNASMSFRHFDYWLLQHGADETFVLTAFPHHTPKALVLFYLPSNQFNEDENIYGLPSFREWLEDGYAIMSVALESGLRGFETSKRVLEKTFEIADGLPVLAVGVGTAGNYAILNSNGKARTFGLCGFIGINTSLDWPMEKLSSLAQVDKIEVPGYLIDDKNGEFAIFLQEARLKGKSIQGLHVSEKSNCMDIREKTTIATPLALQLAVRLLSNVPSQ